MKSEVQILLSSYNGEKYIREQLDSILKQEEVQLHLLIRDDGSTDGTKAILSEYEQNCDNVKVLYGKNVGVVQSFFALMEAAEEGCPYIAFADQDDVWLPDKLARAVSLLEKQEQSNRKKNRQETPLVYCSARQLADAELRPLKQAIRYPEVRAEFGNALVENMCTGCTCVINQAMLRLLKGRQPEFTVMHDFWIYLVGTCFGTVIYDKESRILYRQHGNNELGSASSLFENYKRRVKNYKKHRGQLGRQASQLLMLYGEEMPVEKRELAEELVRARKDKATRRKLLKERKIFRQRRSDDGIMKVLLLFGLL